MTSEKRVTAAPCTARGAPARLLPRELLSRAVGAGSGLLQRLGIIKELARCLGQRVDVAGRHDAPAPKRRTGSPIPPTS